MWPQDIIEKKRDGNILTDGEINAFVDGICDRTWADYQISALLMAMFTRGLNKREQTSITRAMLESGTIMDLSDIDAPKADKHSTGGVGDKTSLMVAPIAAVCGIVVPMISGRGLGHTGGTLDKLESIPGYSVKLSFTKLKRVVRSCGFAMAGQTDEIAPADKKLYALRDATATVPYIPLIVASIMSKKLAEGLDALVLDVKTGSGAFIPKLADSIELARALCETGRSFGVRTEALVTDMSQPLGKFVGNAVEVYECVKLLRGEGEELMQPTLDLSTALTAEMLVECGVADSIRKARKKIDDALISGKALEKFRSNIELQGGDPRVCDRPEMLLAKGIRLSPVNGNSNGFVSAIDTLTIGHLISEIGGGRVRTEDKVDHAVGYASFKKIGDAVKSGEEIGVIYARDRRQADSISERLRDAYKISGIKPRVPKLIRATV